MDVEKGVSAETRNDFWETYVAKIKQKIKVCRSLTDFDGVAKL